MPNLKLSYFDFHGGRGEVTRLALAIGGVAFEDHRIPLESWPEVKGSLPFHEVPVLELDGEVITQSNAINRYVGRLTKLYPEDPLQALYCDEVMDTIEDIANQIVATFPIEDEEEKRLAREALVEGPIPFYLKGLERMLERGGTYFADQRPTIADLKAFIWVRSLRSGTLDHIPIDLSDRTAPGIAAHCDRMAAHPAIVGYYERF